MTALDFLDEELAELEVRGLLRRPDAAPTALAALSPSRAGDRPNLIDACSNDYLGYGRAAVSRATLLACAEARTGAAASRLIRGTTEEHLALEREVADWVGLEAALGFSSGYAANVGVLAALCRSGDVVISDALNHASIIDGCRLSRATTRVVPHLDLGAVKRELCQRRAGRAWVVTESYFSMDADSPDLRRLRALCDEAEAGLVVDEAHALGCFGPEGGGLCRSAGVRPDVLVGTLGKAIGVQGAFVAGERRLQRWLWNRARSLVFSTAPAPLVARLATENVRRARSDDASRQRLHQMAESLGAKLRAAGVPLAAGARGAIFPIVLGDNARALTCATELFSKGIATQAIRPPTVPEGTARLRVTLSAALTDVEVERLGDELCATCNGS